LEYDAIGEKMVLDELEELALINGRRLEHVRVRGSHGESREISSKKWIARAEEEDGSGKNVL
jgi:hypothetical protein